MRDGVGTSAARIAWTSGRLRRSKDHIPNETPSTTVPRLGESFQYSQVHAQAICLQKRVYLERWHHFLTISSHPLHQTHNTKTLHLTLHFAQPQIQPLSISHGISNSYQQKDCSQPGSNWRPLDGQRVNSYVIDVL